MAQREQGDVDGVDVDSLAEAGNVCMLCSAQEAGCLELQRK